LMRSRLSAAPDPRKKSRIREFFLTLIEIETQSHKHAI
jgi:hypothetical protein